MRSLLLNARQICEKVIEMQDPEVSQMAVKLMADLIALVDERQMLETELNELKDSQSL